MKNILYSADPAEGGDASPAADPPAKSKPTIVSLTAQLEQANATIATQKATIKNLTAAKAEADADEKLILAKMGLGLTRDQATAVVKRQKTHDESPLAKQHARANEKAAKRKAAAEKENEEPQTQP